MTRTPSRLPELGPRGEGWVVLQVLLIAAVVGCGLAGPSWPASVDAPLTVAGVCLVLAGVTMLVLGARALGSSLTPMPRPRDDARLVERGILCRARHPLYGGAMLLTLGFSLATSPLTVVPTALLALLLVLKSQREEAWLVERYPEYDAYRARTPRRFVPWLF